MVCAGGLSGLAREGEFGNKGVEDGRGFGSRKEARGEQVLASHERFRVARFDERVEAIAGSKVLRR